VSPRAAPSLAGPPRGLALVASAPAPRRRQRAGRGAGAGADARVPVPRRYALNGKEVKSILKQRLVKIDGKIKTEVTYPVGFMDVVEIEKTDEHFRLVYDTKGRFVVHRITREEASYKLCKVGLRQRPPQLWRPLLALPCRQRGGGWQLPARSSRPCERRWPHDARAAEASRLQRIRHPLQGKGPSCGLPLAPGSVHAAPLSAHRSGGSRPARAASPSSPPTTAAPSATPTRRSRWAAGSCASRAVLFDGAVLPGAAGCLWAGALGWERGGHREGGHREGGHREGGHREGDAGAAGRGEWGALRSSSRGQRGAAGPQARRHRGLAAAAPSGSSGQRRSPRSGGSCSWAAAAGGAGRWLG
jgi:hypothetical protein